MKKVLLFLAGTLTGAGITLGWKKLNRVKKEKKEKFDQNYAEYLKACKELVEAENDEEKSFAALCKYLKKKERVYLDHLEPIWWVTRDGLSKEDENLEKKAYSIMEKMVEKDGWPTIVD